MVVFFFKQKTAYEMRISDWSSDVCSSDLSIGFYTVMAYPQADGDQFAIRHFANPNVTYLSRATGVANQSDNVRSLNQSMPIIATFRATVTPVSGLFPWTNAFNGDSVSDILDRQSTRLNSSH